MTHVAESKGTWTVIHGTGMPVTVDHEPLSFASEAEAAAMAELLACSLYQNKYELKAAFVSLQLLETAGHYSYSA